MDEKEYNKQYQLKNKERLKIARKEYYEKNKERCSERCRKYREANKEKLKEKRKEYYLNNKKKILGWQKKYRKNNPEKIKKCRQEYYQKNKEKAKRYRIENWGTIQARMKIYRQENKEKLREKDRKCHQRLKIEVLTHYGQGRLRCVQCGFDEDFHALSLDHVDGGGEKDRRKFGTGVSFFYYLRRNNYPDGFQTLCMNCQFIKAHENDEYPNKYGISRR